MKKRRALNWNRSLPWLMLSVSLLGFCFFYLIPFMISFAYSVTDNPISKKFYGMKHYIELFHNQYFMRGLSNTAKFILISIPLNMLLSLAVALVINKIKKYPKLLCLIFLIPLAIPSATSAFFWESFFGQHGSMNKLLSVFGIESIDWFNSKYSLIIIIIIFVWKNIGYNMALFLSGLSSIPKQYYEYAGVEGANGLWKLKNITMVYLTPTIFLVLIMTFVNSFKVFKEIYIITGEYPPDGLYVLQHYMNNMFLSLNYSKLVSAVYILTIAVVIFVVCIFREEKKLSENLHY